MVLLDTAPLVALCDARDSLHRTAVRHLKLLSGLQFGLCEPVLTEACFLLSTPPQRARLSRLLEAFNVSPVLPDDEFTMWKQVFKWLDKYRHHEPDFADAYLAVLCGLDSKYRIWTYDQEFRTVWRKPNGAAIPMAVRGKH